MQLAISTLLYEQMHPTHNVESLLIIANRKDFRNGARFVLPPLIKDAVKSHFFQKKP